MLRRTVWWDIIRENTRVTADLLRIPWFRGSPAIPILTYVMYILCVWVWLGADEATLEIKYRIALYAAPAALYVPWWIVHLFARTIPDREIRFQDRIQRLRYFLTPRLDLEVLEDGRPLVLPEKTTKHWVNGHWQINITSERHIICGVVTNNSKKDADGAQVRLVELVGDNGRKLRDSVDFHWAPVNHDGPYASVPANGRATIKMFRVTGNAVQFERDDELPLDYLNFFEGGTRFTGKLAISDSHHAASIASFVLETSDTVKMHVLHVEGIESQSPKDIEQELENLHAA